MHVAVLYCTVIQPVPMAFVVCQPRTPRWLQEWPTGIVIDDHRVWSIHSAHIGEVSESCAVRVPINR